MDVVTLGMAKAASKRTADGIAKRTALIPIASRANVYTSGLSNGTDTSMTSKTSHKAIHDITEVRLVFGNFYNNAGVETAGPNDISVKFAIQVSTDTYRVRGTFGAKRTIVIEPGTRATSDAIPVDIKAGEIFFVYTYVSVASAGMKWPQGLQTQSPESEGRIVAVDYTDTGTVTIGSFFSYGPMQILGRPPKADTTSVGGIGDSIMAGSGDSNTFGFWARSLYGNISEQRIAYAGEQAAGFLRRDLYQYRIPLLAYATHIACELGINDVKGGITLANLQSSILTIWARAARRAAKVYQTTLTPVTTSTDTWATTANQAVTANESVRVGFNNWVRAGAPVDPGTGAAVAIGTSGALVAGNTGHPLTGYIELADTVETARNSGIWKSGHTGDGTHPNVTGHTAMAAVFTPALFT